MTDGVVFRDVLIAESSPGFGDLLATLRMSLRLAGLGVMEIGLTDRAQYYWMSEVYAIFGLPADTAPFSLERIIEELVIAEDRERVRRALHAVMRDGEEAELEFKIRRPDTALRILHVIAARVVSAESNQARLIAVLRDETDRKQQADAYRLFQERLLNVSRSSALGEMASGMAHELNQPLAAIATFAQTGSRLAARSAGPIDALRDIFDEIAEQALRAGKAIRSMRKLVNSRDRQYADIDVAGVIRELQEQFDLIGKLPGIPVVVEAPQPLPSVHADAAQVQHVVLALVRNAVEAQSSVRRADPVRVAASAEPDWVEVSVRDMGPGVEASSRDQLFKPFFTTKAEGVGLGLASSRALIDNHQGKIGFESPAAGGARFWFKLPR